MGPSPHNRVATTPNDGREKGIAIGCRARVSTSGGGIPLTVVVLVRELMTSGWTTQFNYIS